MKKKTAYIASGSAILALLLSACGGGESKNALEDVQYSLNGATAEPSVSFATPLAVTETLVHTIEEGTGDTIEDGDSIMVDATVFNGADGSSAGTTYTDSPMIIPVGEQLKEAAPELYELLVGSKVGMSFAYSTNIDPLAAANSTASPAPTLSAGSATNLEVYTVTSKLLKSAQGQENEKKSAALEKFTLEGTAASIVLAEDRGDAPKELYTEDLITGEGAKVGADDTVYANYIGVTWSDGQTFDENFSTQPMNFSLNSVIEGWTKGLEGKTVGSRVLLIIPSEMAYGEDAASTGAPEGALVFVVDILGTSPSRAAAASEAAASAHAEASVDASAEPTATETK